jgi:hypothetical protein
MRQLYDRIEGGQTVNLNDYLIQRTLQSAAAVTADEEQKML